MGFGSIINPDNILTAKEWAAWNKERYVVDGNKVILWDKSEYDNYCKTLNPPWEWPYEEVEVGNKIDKSPGVGKKPIWTQPPSNKNYKIEELKDQAPIIIHNILFDGKYKDKKDYKIGEVSVHISGNVWKYGFMFLVYGGKQQYMKLKVDKKSEWDDYPYEVKGDKVYLWDKGKYEADQPMWDWPYEDIGNVEDTKNRNRNKKMPKPIVEKHRIMELKDGDKLRFGNLLYHDNDNSGKRANWVHEVKVLIDKGRNEKWINGFMYLVYQGTPQFKDPRTIRSADSTSSRKDPFDFSTKGHRDNTTKNGPVPPVRKSEAPKGARISSGFYRNFITYTIETIKGKKFHEFHCGIDIGVSEEKNVPARAMYRAKFISSKSKDDGNKAGNRITMQILEGEYKNYFLTYMHLKNHVTYDKNKEFNAGEQVGIVGKSGDKKYKEHLHLQITNKPNPAKKRQYKNPKSEKEKKENEVNFVNLNKFFADRRKDKEWYEIYTADVQDSKDPLAYVLVNNPEGTDTIPKIGEK